MRDTGSLYEVSRYLMISLYSTGILELGGCRANGIGAAAGSTNGIDDDRYDLELETCWKSS